MPHNIMRIAVIASVVLLSVLSAGLLLLRASAYTSYTPAWYDRLNISLGSTTYQGEVAWSVDADNQYVYAGFTFIDNAQGTLNASLEELWPSNGSFVNGVTLYVTGANTSIKKVIASTTSYAYAIGTFTLLSDDTSGIYVVALNKSSLNLVTHTIIYNTSVGNYYAGDACVDAAGNIYIAGYVFNTSSEYMGFIAKLPGNLSSVSAIEYYVNPSYETIFTGCTLGPDGYLYITAQLIYYYSLTGYYYPIRLVVAKIDPVTLEVVNTTSVSLVNSQGYANARALLEADIATDGVYLYTAFGYTDEYPDPTSPTTGASIIKLDTGLNILWRLNISTDYYEGFRTVIASSNGEVIAAGRTNNDYGTGLGTSYYKSFIVQVGSDASLQQAILFGASDAGSGVFEVAIGPDGSIYSASDLFSDNLSFYNVTSDVAGVVTVSSTASLKAPAIIIQDAARSRGPRGEAVKISNKAGTGEPVLVARPGVIKPGAKALKTKHLGKRHGRASHPPPITITSTVPTKTVPRKKGSTEAIEPRRVKPQPLNPGTPSGGSSALLVKHSWTVAPPPTPPQPVPENPLLVVVAAVVSALALYFTMRRH